MLPDERRLESCRHLCQEDNHIGTCTSAEVRLSALSYRSKLDILWVETRSFYIELSPPQVWVSMLMLLNMGVALTAEFTAVGDLYSIVIGAVRWPIVVIIALVSTIYTAYGGLHVSIITDQARASHSVRHQGPVYRVRWMG